MAEWREICTITDADSREVVIGITAGRVTLRTLGTRTGGAVELDGVLAEDFMQGFVSACWQVTQQLAGTAVTA